MTTLTLQEKKCLFCAEAIRMEAIKCKHCGSFQDAPREIPQQIAPSRTDVLILVALLAVPFLLGGLCLAWYNTLPAADRARVEQLTQPAD